jgi:hypothetical protein
MVRLSFCLRRTTPKIRPDKKGDSVVVTKLSGLDKETTAIAKSLMTAMAAGKRVEIVYNGLPRIVEVHAVGLSTTGKPSMRVYQVMGDSHSGEGEGWKLMSLGKVFTMPQILDIESSAPRPGYNRGDAGMSVIFNEV